VLGGTWKGKAEDYLDNESRLAAFREAAKPFCDPYTSVAEWVPDGIPISLSATNYWVTTPWNNHNGRVTLMGDAAHPMTPS
jgi:2-polyprenyl-6-methoxyphenol hydroxylase-like FAD-dependent oxidoreductase